MRFNKDYKEVSNEGIALHNDERRKLWTKKWIGGLKDRAYRYSIICLNDGVIILLGKFCEFAIV